MLGTISKEAWFRFAVYSGLTSWIFPILVLLNDALQDFYLCLLLSFSIHFIFASLFWKLLSKNLQKYHTVKRISIVFLTSFFSSLSYTCFGILFLVFAVPLFFLTFTILTIIIFSMKK